MRKLPTQERAQRTIETIFDATAQIIDEHGEAGLTTNKIAQKAGFSIGTLYQYFPTKEAVLLAMIQRGRRQAMDEMQSMLASAVQAGVDPQQIIRERLHMLIENFGAGGVFKRSMIRMAWRMDHHENVMQALREGAEHIALALSQLQSPAMRTPNAASIFILTRAVMGTLRSASLENSPLLGTQLFEDELVILVWGILKA
ncbi:TetR family transcriptional regulator [Herbaspirillum sp. meg3]|uniref:TetR/AcrR family transcriptional regulator n=1 Tax=Herbaspirillum sp. meg3 TaxID=2025949 RepID=UPI000B98FBBA|nr:TetR/AcrR family transcriptional regulator [Herbaspirillum sp. meg3]ASU41469.1 TetR family transcriptional regulator [Herbaspirillum sp. meg3]